MSRQCFAVAQSLMLAMPMALTTALTTAVLLTGCMSQPYQGQMLFTLDGGATGSAAADATPHTGVLRLRGVSIAQPYATSEFAYRYADGRMRTDPYGGYIASPQVLIGNALVDRLGRERTFETVVGPDMGFLQAHELAVSISTLCAEFGTETPAVHIAGTAFLMDPTADPAALIEAFDVKASAPIQGDSATAVAEAMNAALATWLGELSNEMRAAVVPPLASTPPKRATR